MGYTLSIGQLIKITDICENAVYQLYETEEVKLDSAPAFGEPTDYTNQRWPSYSSWASAMHFVGLYNFMLNDKTGILKEHPGFVRLKSLHKKIIDRAYKKFYRKYPNAKAGYGDKENELFAEEDANFPKENRYAVRLEWLKFWVDWALLNCSEPVFQNS